MPQFPSPLGEKVTEGPDEGDAKRMEYFVFFLQHPLIPLPRPSPPEGRRGWGNCPISYAAVFFAKSVNEVTWTGFAPFLPPPERQ